jgi:hypothetical protein
MNEEYLESDVMKWERIVPPFPWKTAGLLVIAERYLPNGVLQCMVRGSVPKGLVISNAQVIGEDDGPEAEFY